MGKAMIAKARSMGESKETVFCGTRYGNVMASRGSVIPLFIEQIKQGKDLTVTDRNMTRFMMTLEDAVDLVLYEELLSEFEETLPTGNPKIMAGKFRPYDYNGMKNKINLLLKNLNLEEDVELVVRMKDIAPEYISKNSQFEDIDTDNSKIKLA